MKAVDIEFEKEQIRAKDAIQGMGKLNDVLALENVQLRLLLGSAIVELGKVGASSLNLSSSNPSDFKMDEDLHLATVLATRWGALGRQDKARIKLALGVELTKTEEEALNVVVVIEKGERGES